MGTSATTVVTFARAYRWWIIGALAALVLLFAGWYYGKQQYTRGRDLARADIADSVSKVYQAKYEAFRDSTTAQMAAFKLSLDAANARADAADVRATAALRHAASLPPEIIARTPPEVLTAMNELQTALTTEQTSNRELSAKLVDATTLMERAREGLRLADETIAQQRVAIVALQKVKEPAHGFWHTAGVVAEDVGLIVGGAVLTKVIH